MVTINYEGEAIWGEMEELYQIISNESLERISTSHIEMEDLLLVIDSLLHLSKRMHELKESIRCLKNFIGFVWLRELEPQQMGDLFLHVRSVLVDAACFCFSILENLWGEHYDPYELIHRIEPLESQVCEIYFGVLQKDLGFIVCYLFHVDREASLGEKLEHHFISFEEKLKLLKPEERCQLSSECPQLEFIDSLLVKVNSANLYEAADFSSDSTLNKLNTIRDDLVNLRSFLPNVKEQKDQNEKFQVLWNHFARVAYETEFVFDSPSVGDTHQSLIFRLGAITSEIEQIKTEALGIANNMGQLIEFQRTTETDNKKPLAGKILKFDEPIVGLVDESQNIIEGLKRGTEKLDLVFVGMAGRGKTSLVWKIYSDRSITFHFHIRGLCTVSQGRDKRSLLLEILHSLYQTQKSVDDKRTEDDLGNELHGYLKGKGYFVILDDVWDIEVWSRILVTTRSEKVASQIKSETQSLRMMRVGSYFERNWALKKIVILKYVHAESQYQHVARDCH